MQQVVDTLPPQEMSAVQRGEGGMYLCIGMYGREVHF